MLLNIVDTFEENKITTKKGCECCKTPSSRLLIKYQLFNYLSVSVKENFLDTFSYFQISRYNDVYPNWLALHELTFKDR